MTKYEVTVPISGYAIVEVEADSEDLAIEAAIEELCDKEQIEEWSGHKDVVRGNCWHGIGSPHAHAQALTQKDRP